MKKMYRMLVVSVNNVNSFSELPARDISSYVLSKSVMQSDVFDSLDRSNFCILCSRPWTVGSTQGYCQNQKRIMGVEVFGKRECLGYFSLFSPVK